MSKAGKFTRGPWEEDHCTDHGEQEAGYFQIDAPRPKELTSKFRYTVADTMNRDYCISPEEDRANAALIAASPELYAALDAMLHCSGAEMWAEATTAGEKALAKARGESS